MIRLWATVLTCDVCGSESAPRKYEAEDDWLTSLRIEVSAGPAILRISEMCPNCAALPLQRIIDKLRTRNAPVPTAHP